MSTHSRSQPFPPLARAPHVALLLLLGLLVLSQGQAEVEGLPAPLARLELSATVTPEVMDEM